MVHSIPENVNKYQYTLNVASKARKLADKYENIISHSEAISLVLTNDYLKLHDIYEKRKNKRQLRFQSASKEYLLNVLDSNVRNSVEQSLISSKEHRHLIYQYVNIQDIHQMARVRIITNMLYYT